MVCRYSLDLKPSSACFQARPTLISIFTKREDKSNKRDVLSPDPSESSHSYRACTRSQRPTPQHQQVAQGSTAHAHTRVLNGRKHFPHTTTGPCFGPKSLRMQGAAGSARFCDRGGAAKPRSVAPTRARQSHEVRAPASPGRLTRGLLFPLRPRQLCQCQAGRVPAPSPRLPATGCSLRSQTGALVAG